MHLPVHERFELRQHSTAALDVPSQDAVAAVINAVGAPELPRLQRMLMVGVVVDGVIWDRAAVAARIVDDPPEKIDCD